MEDYGKLKVINTEGGTIYVIWCEGCGERHTVDGRWAFDGNYEKPTFSPSLLIRSGHYASNFEGTCWCTYDAQHPDDPSGFKCGVCHSFVKNGKIEYLNDCTHHLAGQTVELKDF